MSQLDLSIAAEVSSRHISFLETGRAQPSREMVLRLAAALGLGLRDSNALLRAADLPRAFAESAPEQNWPPAIERILGRMLAQQEPYPMIVLNARHDVLRGNQAATRVLTRFVANPAALQQPLNLMHLLFHPELMRPHVDGWTELAHLMLTGLQRYAMSRPADSSIPELIRELCAYPGVPEDWHNPAFDLPLSPALEFSLSRGDERVRFLSTVTTFNGPLDVGLEDLMLESLFPADEASEAMCRRAAAENG
jgi:transcriptional regulator with XRE-family HTH domain